jgi:hypothetical protein
MELAVMLRFIIHNITIYRANLQKKGYVIFTKKKKNKHKAFNK